MNLIPIHDGNIDALPCTKMPYTLIVSSTNAPNNLSIIKDEFEPNDVLCGCNSIARGHPGNKKFRQIVQSFRDSYQNATARKIKARITYNVIDIIRGSGGTFLEFDDASGTWYEADNDFVYQKVSHALRSAKDPNRLIPKGRISRNYALTTEQEVMYSATLDDQQKIFERLMDHYSEESINIGQKGIDNMMSQIERLWRSAEIEKENGNMRY